MKSALLFFLDDLLFKFLLIRSFTTASGTFILSRWSLQTQFITGLFKTCAKRGKTCNSGNWCRVSAGKHVAGAEYQARENNSNRVQRMWKAENVEAGKSRLVLDLILGFIDWKNKNNNCPLIRAFQRTLFQPLIRKHNQLYSFD